MRWCWIHSSLIGSWSNFRDIIDRYSRYKSNYFRSLPWNPSRFIEVCGRIMSRPNSVTCKTCCNRDLRFILFQTLLIGFRISINLPPCRYWRNRLISIEFHYVWYDVSRGCLFEGLGRLHMFIIKVMTRSRLWVTYLILEPLSNRLKYTLRLRYLEHFHIWHPWLENYFLPLIGFNLSTHLWKDRNHIHPDQVLRVCLLWRVKSVR